MLGAVVELVSRSEHVGFFFRGQRVKMELDRVVEDCGYRVRG